jgi:hypothetical protein
MASVAQVRANRLNAQKSTGPRTPEGLLAERVAHLGWRLRRAERLENATWGTLEADYLAKASGFARAQGVGRPEGQGPDDQEAVLARVVVKDFGNAKVLDQLSTSGGSRIACIGRWGNCRSARRGTSGKRHRRSRTWMPPRG